jgi:molecular chaperone DnaK
MSKIIAIDLGSTLSEVAVMEGGNATIIVNEEGSRTTPSVISFVNGERKVGAAAKRQMVMNPKETVVLIKRFMGNTYDEVTEDIKHVQYEVVNENGYPRVKIGDKKYTPEELSAMIVGKMKETAETYLGEKVTDAIITVPAYFNDAQRQATKRAGEIAGLNVLRIIAEPTAALLAANLNKKEGTYMVVDYGGATLDFSVADVMDAEGENVIEILASNGDV